MRQATTGPARWPLVTLAGARGATRAGTRVLGQDER